LTSYPYRDEGGALLFEVVRFAPKDFRQRRPDPSATGGWAWRLGNTRRTLFRLPELLAADPAELVIIPEGEKDVDRLRSLGLVATTAPQGAAKWLKVDRAALAGRHVVVLPDNDDPGRKHAAQIVRDLTGKAASVRVLKLPGLPEKGDVSDWLDAGGTAEELRRLAATATGEADADWQDKLHRNERTGEVRDLLHNAVLILRLEPAFAGRIRWNEFKEMVQGRDLPWSPGPDWRDWTDVDDAFLTVWCQ
jgi:hypothetical protein